MGDESDNYQRTVAKWYATLSHLATEVQSSLSASGESVDKVIETVNMGKLTGDDTISLLAKNIKTVYDLSNNYLELINAKNVGTDAKDLTDELLENDDILQLVDEQTESFKRQIRDGVAGKNLEEQLDYGALLVNNQIHVSKMVDRNKSRHAELKIRTEYLRKWVNLTQATPFLKKMYSYR